MTSCSVHSNARFDRQTPWVKALYRAPEPRLTTDMPQTGVGPENVYITDMRGVCNESSSRQLDDSQCQLIQVHSQLSKGRGRCCTVAGRFHLRRATSTSRCLSGDANYWKIGARGI